MRDIALYLVLTLVLFGLMELEPATWNEWTRMALNTLLILAFTAYAIHYDIPLKNLPLVGRFFSNIN
jgi:hypothetical protein